MINENVSDSQKPVSIKRMCTYTYFSKCVYFHPGLIKQGVHPPGKPGNLANDEKTGRNI